MRLKILYYGHIFFRLFAFFIFDYDCSMPFKRKKENLQIPC